MANTIQKTKLLDGARECTFHFYIASDGVSGNLVDYVLVDPATDLVPALSNTPSLTVMKIYYDLAGFNGLLLFNYLSTGNPIWQMTKDNYGECCFDYFGGIKDRSQSGDGNGKILLTTNGFTTVSNTGTFVITLRKD